ncbi:MAG: transglutaminase domain-containing protein [Chloroflexi bacterium]|nr:transglutaminase domain-containing protein [Chloroflexota bacterium]
MSTRDVALPIIPRSGDPSKTSNRLMRMLAQYRPFQGWSSFIFLVFMLLILAESITDAGWVNQPDLPAVIFWAALAGLVMSKARLPALLLHPLGLALGFLVVLWRASVLAEEETGWGRLSELWSRLDVWYEAATNNGLSTDLLPLAIALLALAWLIGYFSSWFVFRNSNPWIAILLSGVAILTNLSFLPEGLAPRFFLFVLFAMLLIVRLTVVQRQREWDTSGMRFELVSGWLTMHSAFWFGILVLIIAVVMPMKVFVSQNLAELWSDVRSPIDSLEEDFARLFSSVSSKKEVNGRFFGKSLPFIGAISFGGEVVFWADTEYPSYWISQTYSEYTSQGWLAGDSRKIEVGPETLPPPRSDSKDRISVEQSLQLNFETDNFLAGGSLDWLSHDAVLETLRPMTFEIDLLDDSSDFLLPTDIQELSAAIREDQEMLPDSFVESYISRFLPPDLVLNEVRYGTDVETGSDFLEGLTLERKAAVASEIVSWRFARRLQRNEPYSMVSFVSLATDEDLREADTDYNHFITDHYLQLPATLPQRVRDMAADLTAGTDNPLDKAVLIQNYLRSDVFTYDQENVVAPPRAADGVDYFLFETKLGYSDYFASAMTVMMRAVGVPTRMAAGYAPGEYDEEIGMRIVRDHDSHGWTQVYFPQYGWIDFEPTPRWAMHDRRLVTGPGSGLLSDRGGSVFSGDESDFVDPTSVESLFGRAIGADGFNLRTTFPFDIVIVLIRSGMALGSAAVLWFILFLVWNWNLRGLSAVEKAYTQMARLGAIAGVARRPDQTPLDYAAALGRAVEDVGTPASRIAWAYSGMRYAGPGERRNDGEAPKDDSDDMGKEWRHIRGPLLSQAIRRLMPGGQRTE